MKNRVLTALAAVICVLVLSNCGGDSGATSATADEAAYDAGVAEYNSQSYASAAAAFQSLIVDYPTSNRVDNAHYYLGKSLYHLNDLSGAIAEFDLVLQNYPQSSLVDNSMLWKGKSLQRQGNIEMSVVNIAAAALKFADARAMYRQVIGLDPASTLIPDCTYQLGLTDYDEKRYADSLPLFQSVFANYPNSIVADGALYYLARSNHELAQAATPGYTFAQARAAYAAMMTSFPLSTWTDNAQYQTGRTYYDELNYVAAIVEFNKVLSNHATATAVDEAQYYLARSIHALAQDGTPGYTYAQARTAYGLIAANYPTSIFVDNAAYRAALTYHDSLQCMLELSAVQAFVTAYPASTFLAKAAAHISDFTLAVPVTHQTCV